MLYNRWWFLNQKLGFTLGGGAMANPGRYLVLTPPINGATAAVNSPYFPQGPGDSTTRPGTLPSRSTTCRRSSSPCAASTPTGEANVPYFAGPGGVTPPGGNTASPADTVPGWAPDLQKTEDRVMLALFVRI